MARNRLIVYSANTEWLSEIIVKRVSLVLPDRHPFSYFKHACLESPDSRLFCASFSVWVCMSGEPAPPSDANDHLHNHPAPRVRMVLLAEDDDAVREFIRVALEQAGYAVVAAPDGRAAGDLFAADPARFDLVLTDVVMPHAIGPELAARVRKLRPGMPVLFMSAFPGGPGVAPNPVPATERLLEKPFTVAALLCAVNDILCSGHG